MSKRVYPVEGRYINDVPAVEHECDDPNCVKSGAFTTDPPPKSTTSPKAPQDAGPLDSASKE